MTWLLHGALGARCSARLKGGAEQVPVALASYSGRSRSAL